MKAFGEFMIVEAKGEGDKTESGIIVASVGNPSCNVSKVLSVGRSEEFYMIEEGDRIIHDATAGRLIKIEGVEYKVMHYTEIFGVM